MICPHCGQETDRKLEVREMFVHEIKRGERKPNKVVDIRFGSKHKENRCGENQYVAGVVWVDVENA